MSRSLPGGVIAAAATPITSDFEPDLPRFATLCGWLLETGCDGLNLCGTTGEATSFTVQQRMALMSTAARSLPGGRLMAGTGAAAVGDAVTLTRHAAELGMAGALLLPPFYYKGIPDSGILGYFERIVTATAATPIALCLYNFPALTGIAYTPDLVASLRGAFGERIAGLKDSSGDLAYAAKVAGTAAGFQVYPSNEAVLLQARAGLFAGCISASANVNAPLCRRAFHDGDGAALERAVRIRALVSRQPLVASVKAVLAHQLQDRAFEALLPPLAALADAERERLVADVAPLLA